MGGKELSAHQTVALIDELESATRLVDLGVAELHALSLANDHYHLPMQLLAQGLERFLKLTYAMAVIGERGTLPTPDSVRGRFGHDLLGLTDELLRCVENADEYVGGATVRADLKFIRTDEDLRSILALLSEFGKGGRYHRLDEFLDPESVSAAADPYQRWQELELEIIRRQPGWLEDIKDPAAAAELQRQALVHLTSRVDRFARVIARMWTLGALPEEARGYTAQLQPFLALQDEALGAAR